MKIQQANADQELLNCGDQELLIFYVVWITDE